MPAATSSAVIVNTTTSAVPRSGCEATSRIAMPATTSSGITSCGERMRPGRCASSFAAWRTSASLAISDGWNCSGPAPSLRRPAPEPPPRAVHAHANPRDLHREQAEERERQERRGRPDDAVEVAPRDDVHADQPERAVDDVLDEEAGPVALPLQERARRRRAVDHHRPEGEEAERGGEEEVVLQRNGPLGLGAGGSAHRT